MASAKLTKTYSSSSNRRTYTLSLWVKFANGDANLTLANIGPFSGDNEFRLTRDSNGRIDFYDYGSSAYKMRIRTNRVFRDIHAWYHIVAAVDTTQGTASNRAKLYINGVQETSFSAETQASSNLETAWGIAQNYTLAATESGNYMDGQIAHFHYVDGTAHTPTTFGETDATTGIWKPKTAPSVTYGSNGFFLKFDNSANMGLDSGGGGNNWTTNGTIIQNKDTPSNVFATFNQYAFTEDGLSNTVFKNGNTTFDSNETGSGVYTTSFSTLGVSSGKYYCEYKTTQAAGAGNMCIGIGEGDGFESYFGAGTNSVIYLGDTGQYRKGGSDTSYGDTYGVGDIIGVAMDLDNNKLYFSKNGTWQNSGDPTSGSTGTGAISISAASATSTGFYFFGVGDKSSSGTCEVSANFGNGYFGTTAVSSAQNPDDGNGIFEYDVPAGYRALCTKSINAEEYS
tara:strand:- start:38 stop:1399 length:1362 start_codon:yes stop_codon:yes gene_type:complete